MHNGIPYRYEKISIHRLGKHYPTDCTFIEAVGNPPVAFRVETRQGEFCFPLATMLEWSSEEEDTGTPLSRIRPMPKSEFQDRLKNELRPAAESRK